MEIVNQRCGKHERNAEQNVRSLAHVCRARERKFEKALQNSLDHLEKDGIMVIDLDNRRSNDDVYDKVDGNKRYMECFYSPKYSMQIRTINFTIGLKIFTFEHEFFIYKKKKLEEILDKYDVSYALLTNFFRQKANDESKRIHVVIRKNG